MTILFVSGVNDHSTIGVNLDDRGNVVHLTDGNCSVHGKLPLKKGIAVYFVIFGKGVKQRGIDFTRKPSLIFNQIADADTHRGALERCQALCEQVRVPVINHPAAILRTARDQVSELLQGIPGVDMPKTVRFQPVSPEDVFEQATSKNIDFPYILRVAGDHNGKSMLLLKGMEEKRNLHVFPFDGRDFYLTEFVDCQDEAGLYHKQRIVLIDGEPILLNSTYGGDWNVHADSRTFMLERESWEKDRARMAMLETEVLPAMGAAFEEIANRMQLEFFGIDCNVGHDGKMLIFEANANMNILHNKYPAANARMNMINKKIHAMLTRHSGEEVI
jgi:glutathione synthase/RimK-type ligase-like ATP-grasp enzyme